jgi:hypothetical protein
VEAAFAASSRALRETKGRVAKIAYPFKRKIA